MDCYPLLTLFYIHSSALISQNGSGPFLRTFSGHFVLVTDEPIDYLDVLGEGSRRGEGSVDRRGEGSVDRRGEGSVDHRGEGSVDHRGEGSVDHRGEGSVDHRGEGSVDHRGEGSVDHRGEGSVDRRGEGSVDRRGEGSVDRRGEGSGSSDVEEEEEEPAKRVPPHRRPSNAKRLLVVSEQTRSFLQGPLAAILVPTVYTLVFSLSVPLNVLAVVMFVRRIGPRTPAVVYMLNLALADLLFAMLLPFKIAYRFHGNHWVYGDALCRVVTASFYANMYCSVLLMSSIAADRYLAVVHPMASLSRRTPGAAAAVCAAAWLLSLGGVVPLLLSNQTLRLASPDITTCHDVQDVVTLRSFYLYFFPVYSSLFFFVPLAVTTVCYVRILRTLAAADVAQRSRKRRAVVTAAAVLLVFVACFTPTNVLLMVHYLRLAGGGATDSSYQAYLLSMCAGSLSCCVDPLVYYYGSSHCRRQVAALLRCRRGTGLRGRGFRSSSSSSSRAGSTRTTSVKMTDSPPPEGSHAHYRKLMVP